jgi:hypothetical protein
MVLATDAVHHNGRVLLRAGAALQDKHIKMFKTWGLISADIEGITQAQVESNLLGDLEPSILEEVQHEMSCLFRHTDLAHPLIGELYRLRFRSKAQDKHTDSCNEVDCRKAGA